MDIRLEAEDFTFKLRGSGVIINDNKILMVSMDDSDFLALPGGYIELGEDSSSGLLRELREEVRMEFNIIKYLGVIENFFINKYNKKMHEIAFYYLVTPFGEIPSEDFTYIENDKGHTVKLDFKWINIDDIDNYNIKPPVLKQLLKSKQDFNHLLVKEM